MEDKMIWSAASANASAKWLR